MASNRTSRTAHRFTTEITWLHQGRVRTERARYCRHSCPWSSDFYLTVTGLRVKALDVLATCG